MDQIKIADEINQGRRRFFRSAAMTFAAVQLGVIDSATAQRGKSEMPNIKPGTQTSFRSLKQIEAGVLNIGYAEDGPADGPAIILLHGWRGRADTGGNFRS
jgi:hypothetical protein